jgi:hypothetical protein
MYRLRMTDDEGGTDFRTLVAEDLAPTKSTPSILADQNDFYEEAIAGWRTGHQAPPLRPTTPGRRSKHTKLNK